MNNNHDRDAHQISRRAPTVRRFLRFWLRGLVCDHEWAWWRDLYGDQINHASVSVLYRSVWTCRICRAFEYRHDLHGPVIAAKLGLRYAPICEGDHP